MNIRSASLLAVLAVSAAGLFSAVSGCELIASVDRSQIDDGAGGEGGEPTTSGGGMGGMGNMGGGGSGGGPECVEATDCPDTGNECIAATCSMEGVCGTMNRPVDTPVQTQPMGDCKTAVCDGNGGVTTIDNDADIEDDSKSCTTDTCSDGNPVHMPVMMGIMCMDGGGKVCSTMGECVECNVGADCATGVCQVNVCQAAECGDGVQNGDETDTDCGGSCGACADGLMCMIPGDCQSSVCTTNVCQVPNCTDTVENGNETDVDCGGGTCGQCTTGQGCMAATDCVGGSCLMSVCAPTCSDQLENNGETDVDCGGPNCSDCSLGEDCLVDTDCATGFCMPGDLDCAIPTCTDTFKNGMEGDVDCGGTCPNDCMVGQTCNVDSDCVTSMCYAGVCVSSVNGCDVATATVAAVPTQIVTFANMNFTYLPKCLKVIQGNSVQFNGNFVAHPLLGGEVNAAGMEIPATTGPFVPVTNMGTTKTVVMNTLGTFPYYCVPHGPIGMNGVVFVVPP